MASFLLRPTIRPLAFTFGVGLTTSALLLHPQTNPLRSRKLLACETSSSPFYQRDRVSNLQAQRNSGLNPRTLKQITTGSFLGLVGGVIIGFLSKPLAVILGALVCGNVWLESRGVRLIPYDKLQSLASNVDLKAAVQENIALKISFGITFALAGFADF